MTRGGIYYVAKDYDEYRRLRDEGAHDGFKVLVILSLFVAIGVWLFCDYFKER